MTSETIDTNATVVVRLTWHDVVSLQYAIAKSDLYEAHKNRLDHLISLERKT